MKSHLTLAMFIAAWLMPMQVMAANEQEHAHVHAKEQAVKPQSDAKKNEEHEKHGENEEHEEHEEHNEHEHNETLSSRISDDMATAVNIVTDRADSQLLRQHQVVYGKLSADPNRISHVNARFPGLLTSVKFSLGDSVKAGDVLAVVESNESLNTYAIKAPIDGVIIQRSANVGEVAQQQTLFSIADFGSLWADFRVYPSQQVAVATGQNVVILAADTEINGVIAHIIPSLTQPYQLARVKLDNRDGKLSSGQLIEGAVISGEFNVELAVKKSAIQILDNQSGVFVKNNTEYVFTPLQLGRSDMDYVEVIAGLKPGQWYVTTNSYLLKADIEKSEAEHDH
ncbi:MULTISPECIES: efflux RND transporter periplasmic adaptor subunit [Pseudidiomarina]|uniref:Cobalt-zinc-cadmium efflux system membrane fusion protein n=2 Tax=Pseudidiomarina TaxID=2800384 RepID=A0A368V226_9GAMM|nr:MULTISPECIES: efflux RND transporter periplasmic adaptor subunit [Pseudidiomarina]PWW15145.1 cobalt-zinc-cadmium efflux system membrane fusion protein [Pseudidiomarina maritima]RBP91689.1 cobalt-zinc-cadmium efflux system membrane fusion protein [Pseudidiomarina tainanensis]RCW35119.1 cobalt-zinc-cadmium efflux system membrane fusion protein [Pseudidiomarina tainanensis]